MQLVQAKRAVSYLLIDSMRQPKTVFLRAKKVGAELLDEEFQVTSPIPLLGDEILQLIYRFEISLPPMARFEGGNQSISGLIFLASLVRATCAKSIFEIGTYNGVTAWCLARNAENSIVDTLDLQPNEQTVLPLAETDASNRRAFRSRTYPLPEGSGRVVQHWGDSATFDFSPWKAACDLVYVDGAHSAPYVESDTKNALTMIEGGGVIVWDDYWRRISGVRTVLDNCNIDDLYRIPATRLVAHLPKDAIARIAAAVREYGASQIEERRSVS